MTKAIVALQFQRPSQSWGQFQFCFLMCRKVVWDSRHAEIMKNVYAFSYKCVYCFNPVEWSKNWLEGWWKVETHFGQVPIFVSFSPRNLWNMLQLLTINQLFSFLNWMKNVGRVMIWVFGRRVDRGRWSLGGGQEDWRR